jgi:hypothetical protein
VQKWLFDELFGGESLLQIINTRHENVKYLPNFELSIFHFPIPFLQFPILSKFHNLHISSFSLFLINSWNTLLMK